MESKFFRVAPWIDVGETPKELSIIGSVWLPSHSLEIEVVCPLFGSIGRTETFDERIPQWIGEVMGDSQVEQSSQDCVVY